VHLSTRCTTHMEETFYHSWSVNGSLRHSLLEKRRHFCAFIHEVCSLNMATASVPCAKVFYVGQWTVPVSYKLRIVYRENGKGITETLAIGFLTSLPIAPRRELQHEGVVTQVKDSVFEHPTFVVFLQSKKRCSVHEYDTESPK